MCADDGTPNPPPTVANRPKLVHITEAIGPQYLAVVREKIAYRWYDRATSITTIRRKLNVSIPVAESIVRQGLKARFDRNRIERKAA